MMPNYDKSDECKNVLMPLLNQIKTIAGAYRIPTFAVWATGKTDAAWKTRAMTCNFGRDRTPAIFAAFYSYVTYGQRHFMNLLKRVDDKGLNQTFDHWEVVKNDIGPLLDQVDAFCKEHKVPLFFVTCGGLDADNYHLHKVAFNGGNAEEDFPLMFGVFAWLAHE